MIKTPLSTVIGGAFWTPGATVIGGSTPIFDQQIQKLFANGEQGFAYDLNDLSTMFRDAAGTVPVTGVGQPVGLIRDKSGRNNHAFQTTSASRPILRKNAVTGANYLEFDGSDDFLQTSNIDFTGTDKVSLFAGYYHPPETPVTMVLAETSTAFTAQGAFALLSESNIESAGMGQIGGYAWRKTDVLTRPSRLVTSIKFDFYTTALGSKIVGRLNGATSFLQIVGHTGGTITKAGNYPLYIGRRGGISQSFNGHLYGLIGIGKLTTDNETVAIEKELAKRVGVTLNV